jgi:hypothetical protein
MRHVSSSLRVSSTLIACGCLLLAVVGCAKSDSTGGGTGGDNATGGTNGTGGD